MGGPAPAVYGGRMRSLSKLMGSNVRRARLSRGWTQEDLAEHSGLDPSTISRIESGKSLRQVEKVGEAMERAGIPQLALLQGDTKLSPEAEQVATMYDAADARTQSMIRHVLEMALAAQSQRDAG